MNITPERYARLLRHALRCEDAIGKASALIEFQRNMDGAQAHLIRVLEGYCVGDDKVSLDWLDKYREAEAEADTATWESSGKGFIEVEPSDYDGPDE